MTKNKLGYQEVKGDMSLWGKIVRVVFWLYQILMAMWLFSYWGEVGKDLHQSSSAAQAGAAIGSALGTGMIFFFWVSGTVIIGIPVLMTRVQKYLIKIDEEKSAT